MPTALLAGENEFVRRTLGPALSERGYTVVQVETVLAATRVLVSQRPAVVVCSAELPDGPGSTLVSVARQAHPGAAVVLYGSAPDARDVRQAMLAGASDYFMEPFTLAELTAAVDQAVQLRASATSVAGMLTLASTGLAETLINAMEAKNAYLRGHSQRVADLAASSAEVLNLPADVVEQVRLAGHLHDIGKIGIREAVLDKPGALTPDEYAHVQDHVRIGLEILSPMAELGDVLAFISHHHERLDGTGYPRRISGEAISLGGRILAATDTFDALTSRRAYRDSRSEAETLSYMSSLVGRSLFPDAFAALREAVERRRSLVFLGERHVPAEHVEHRRAQGPAELSELVAAIHGLPLEDRLALTLFYLEGLDDAEIGEIVDAEPGSVATRREQTLRRLGVRACDLASMPVTPQAEAARPPVRATHAIWLMRRAAMLHGTSADPTEEPVDLVRAAVFSAVAGKISHAVDDAAALRLTTEEAKALTSDARMLSERAEHEMARRGQRDFARCEEWLRIATAIREIVDAGAPPVARRASRGDGDRK
jgi:putative nucleotidyltransferase with HDIG domain